MGKSLHRLAPLLGASCVLYAQSTTPDTILKQRLHQNALRHSEQDGAASLRAEAARKSHDVVGIITQEEDFYTDLNAPPINPDNDPAIKIGVKYSDIVAVGRIVETISELTQKESFIISDGQFALDMVWHQSKENLKSFGSLQGKEVTVTYPGGHVLADGHILDVRLSSEPPLELNHTYLLFLQYIPVSDSYEMIGFKGFDITEKKVRTLYRNPEWDSRPIMFDKNAFIEAAHNSVNLAIAEIQK